METISTFQSTLVETDKETLSRRTVVTAGLAHLALLGAAAYGWKKMREQKTSEVPLSELPADVVPSIEAQPVMEARAENFVDEIRGYARLLQLRFDEVQFVTTEGAPIGDPIALSEIGVDPGVLDAHGFPIKGIRSEWLDEARAFVTQEAPFVLGHEIEGSISQFNVTAQLRAALREGHDEPELVAGIENGTIASYGDIVKYFAEKSVKGAETFTRFGYVRDTIRFADTVPAIVQAELRKLIPALCVQESGFNNDAKSRSGAYGIFQFMPDTWAEFSDTPLKEASLREQVEVAGKVFSHMYTQLVHACGDEALLQLASQSESEESFQVEVLVPLLVNGYNAGQKRMGDAVKSFIADQKTRNVRVLVNKPFDLYASIADYADSNETGTLVKYDDDARQYVPRIYGNALAFEKVHFKATVKET